MVGEARGAPILETTNALKIALDQLAMDVGIVGRVVGDRFEVEEIVAPEDSPLQRGQRFALKDTYCEMTYTADSLVCIDEVSSSDHWEHPCFRATKIESYIGVPLRVRGWPYGTLSLSAWRRRPSSFSSAEKALVRLVGSWVEQAFEHEELLRELQQTAHRFRAIFEQSPDPMVLHRDGVILEANAATANFLGAEDPSLIVGRHLIEFISDPIDRERSIARLARLQQGEANSDPDEVTIRRLDGKTAPLETVGVPLEFADGRVALTIGRDTSERRRALRKMMRQSEKLASLGVLTASVAHELNNPLAYIQTNLDLALELLDDEDTSAESDNPEELRSLLEEARDGTQRSARIVRELRSFSAVDDEAMTPQDVHQHLQAAIRLTRNEVRHRAELTTMLGDVPPVDADEVKLTQVFTNLILNAAQAMPEAPAEQNRICVATGVDEDGNVQIVFTDSGKGVDPKILPVIFEEFVSTKGRREGTGIGLSLCRRLLTEMHGEIEASNNPEGGACFVVTLPPSTQAPTQVSSLTDGSSERPPELPSTTGGGRVLVVDDDVLVARSIRRALEPALNVDVVHGGRDALEQLEKAPERYDIILCDLMMPDLPGWELWRLVEQKWPKLASRFLFVTGGSLTGAGEQFLLHGEYDYLEKPFSLAALRRLVHTKLEGWRATRFSSFSRQ